MPGILVDGNDVLASLAVTRAALQRARAGEGPTLIEAYTYRMEGHTSADDPSRYRTAAEVDFWLQKDPIRRFDTYLKSLGWIDETYCVDVRNEAEELAVTIRAQVRAMAVPDPVMMFDDIYVDTHPLVAEERAQFVAEHRMSTGVA
jgi:pyruvate dehydrogenase E1 component alpha subunit